MGGEGRGEDGLASLSWSSVVCMVRTLLGDGCSHGEGGHGGDGGDDGGELHVGFGLKEDGLLVGIFFQEARRLECRSARKERLKWI
jgi:hypothetical protein